MSDIIRLLPDSVANQIAAGEVIQRPASVVKELVENAVDAGATSIQVIIRDAGRTLVQVIDDGCGMSDTDARMAFERHATSKIEKADDLFSLHTMGFRGEALASIAAVAQIDLRTMPHGAEMGTRLIINGSKVESQTPQACVPGSNMMVKNLFFNVPARRKFLKKDTVEMSNVLREFERLALVNPGIDMELVSNDAPVHKLRRASLKQRITDLFGKTLDKQLLPVGTSTTIVTIDGFICRPEYARRRGALQYFMVNGRHMRHPFFHKALMLCYEKLIPIDCQPGYFINFTVDPHTIDVNIHPTKNEIKFENEGEIRQILMAAVKESLGSFNAVPAIDFDSSEDGIEIPVYNPVAADKRPEVELDPNYNPFAKTRQAAPARDNGLNNWESLFEDFKKDSGTGAPRPSALPGMEEPAELDFSDLDQRPAEIDFGSFQLRDRFIVTPSKSGLMIVEQNRAHVRVLFENYCRQLENNEIQSQQVLFPEVLHLTPAESETMQRLSEFLSQTGFETSFLGDNDWSISAVPAVNVDVAPRDLLLGILNELEGVTEPTPRQLKRHVALSLARSAAIPVGLPLNAAERERLLEDLFRLPAPNYTPDGKLIISIIPLDRIFELF